MKKLLWWLLALIPFISACTKEAPVSWIETEMVGNSYYIHQKGVTPVIAQWEFMKNGVVLEQTVTNDASFQELLFIGEWEVWDLGGRNYGFWISTELTGSHRFRIDFSGKDIILWDVVSGEKWGFAELID